MSLGFQAPQSRPRKEMWGTVREGSQKALMNQAKEGSKVNRNSEWVTSEYKLLDVPDPSRNMVEVSSG